MTTRQPLVLLVDDEQDLCMLMQMSLSRMGIKTHMAHHLQQAKYFFSEYKYDACITDLNLPDGSGLDLVKHVSQHYPKTPIEPYRVCRRPLFLRECPDEKSKIHP